MKTRTTIAVECDQCGAVFRALVGWQRYDERVARKYENRGERPTYRLGFDQDREMRISLRQRQCRDHGDGTQGCEGRVRRADRKGLRPGRAPFGYPDSAAN